MMVIKISFKKLLSRKSNKCDFGVFRVLTNKWKLHSSEIQRREEHCTS